MSSYQRLSDSEDIKKYFVDSGCNLVKLICFLIFCAFLSIFFGNLLRDRVVVNSKASNGYRLPGDVSVTSQTLRIQPFLQNDTFQGTTRISGKILAGTKKIVLHGRFLDIKEYIIRTSNKNLSTHLVLDPEKDFVSIEFVEGSLSPGEEFELYFTFSGVLSGDNDGFYKGSYMDEDGSERFFATTQFQPTSARQAFPCFDEPRYKIDFSISIIREADYTSLSNGRLLKTIRIGENLYEDFFETIHNIPTYSIAFHISQFSNSSNNFTAIYGVPLAVHKNQTGYALEASPKILSLMENYTGIPFAIKKMQEVAIPDEYFTALAMENWGLVTYAATSLLLDEDSSTTEEKTQTLLTMAHELSHQWFGNLVTPEWWSYLWLNEGFATYFEYYLLNTLEPSWRMEKQFAVNVVQQALNIDSVETSRPITFDAGSPQEVDSLFDNIAYDKAGSVIRMMKNFLSEDVFQNGIKSYLNTLKYQTATEDDLYRHMQKALNESGKELDNKVEEIMMTWTRQSGYPVVTVKRAQNGSLILEQQRFLSKNVYQHNFQVWYIPISFTKSTDIDFNSSSIDFWMTTETSILEANLKQDEWYILNKKQMGFYRVNYDLENWFWLSKNISKLPAVDRATLVDDAFKLAKAGRLDYRIVLNLISNLKSSKEADFIVLTSLVNNLDYLYDMLRHIPNLTKLKLFIGSVFDGAYQKLGPDRLEGDSHSDVLARIKSLNWICKVGCYFCYNGLYQVISRDPEKMHPDLQEPGYCSMGEFDFDNLYAMFYKSNASKNQKSRMIHGLACTRDFENVQRLLEDSLTNVDADLLLAIIGGSHEGLHLALEYLYHNIGTISKRFSKEQVAIILSVLSNRLNSSRQLHLFSRIFSSLGDDDRDVFSYNFREAKAQIQANIFWVEKYSTLISNWLENT